MRIALVTGAGSGLGRLSAAALASAGFHVVVCRRRFDALEQTIAAHGDAASMTAIACDVSSPESVDQLLERIEQGHGRLDLLFNNAGTNVPAMTIDELTVEQWKQVMDVNLHGAFLIARAAFGLMRRQRPQGGRIINNGSISAQVPRPGSVPYTVSKAAIAGLTKTLSLDGRAFDIACGQIDIGNASSAMTERMSGGVPQADGSSRAEPVMEARHVADAIVAMAQLPLSANVQSMTLMASGMPFIGRG